MEKPRTILFTVHRDDHKVRVGLPPQDPEDDFAARAVVLGNFENIKKIAFSPKGELYAIHNEDLYVGPIPSPKFDDWLSVAKKVGSGNWDRVNFLLFHPKGELYAATYDGKLYKGPAPDNEHVPWFFATATKIGGAGWNAFQALFFDPIGMLFAVTDYDRLVKRSPPTSLDDPWFDLSVQAGTEDWYTRTHFMSFTPDGKLWCVEYGEGKIFCGDPPFEGFRPYNPTNVGKGFTQYRLLAFTLDKIIRQIISFKFLPDRGRTISETLEVLNEERYYNKKSTVPMKHTFSVDKTITQSSEFSREHGFTVEVGAELKFNGGIPFIAETELTISMNFSTSHNWSFTETNETSVTFTRSSTVEVPAGKDISVIASVRKAQMEVPYEAEIYTMFGYKTTINGKWKGATVYNLRVDQEDI